MTINQVFEQAISAIKGQPMYAGQFYSPEGVVAIIKDIQSKVVGNGVLGITGEPGQVLITHEMRDRLVELIDEQVQDGISRMRESDIVDLDTIEMSINGRTACVEKVEVDTDAIHCEVTYYTDSTVCDWLNRFNIEVEE